MKLSRRARFELTIDSPLETAREVAMPESKVRRVDVSGMRDPCGSGPGGLPCLQLLFELGPFGKKRRKEIAPYLKPGWTETTLEKVKKLFRYRMKFNFGFILNPIETTPLESQFKWCKTAANCFQCSFDKPSTISTHVSHLPTLPLYNALMAV